MTQVIRVQVPVWAPHLFCWRPGAAATPGRLAQLVEHLVYTEGVGGSSPSPPTSTPIWLPSGASLRPSAGEGILAAVGAYVRVAAGVGPR